MIAAASACVGLAGVSGSWNIPGLITSLCTEKVVDQSLAHDSAMAFISQQSVVHSDDDNTLLPYIWRRGKTRESGYETRHWTHTEIRYLKRHLFLGARRRLIGGVGRIRDPSIFEEIEDKVTLAGIGKGPRFVRFSKTFRLFVFKIIGGENLLVNQC